MPPNLFVVMVEFDKKKGDPRDKFLKSSDENDRVENENEEPLDGSTPQQTKEVKFEKSGSEGINASGHGGKHATEDEGDGKHSPKTGLQDAESSLISSRNRTDSAYITFSEIQAMLEETLDMAKGDKLLLYDPVWTYGAEHCEEHLTITFPCKQDHTDALLQSIYLSTSSPQNLQQEVLTRLQNIGIGTDVGAISILPTSYTKAYQDPNAAMLAQSRRAGTAPAAPGAAEAQGAALAEKERQLVVDTCSQIRIEQVVEQVQSGGEMSFDYILLVMIAASLAGTGLATDNTVVIVASMLVSPIMGPIMAFTFGATMRNWKLVKMGLKNEIFSLLLCVFMGIVVACVSYPFDVDELWPTAEMEGRGSWMGLNLGIAIAVPSGMGVALSILGNNTSSLVGVAISASLLPPAVNCGMLLTFAALASTYEDDVVDRSYMIKCGLASLCLTLVNIGCIFITSVVMFKIKEVAPLENKSAFWVDLKRHKKNKKRGRGGAGGGGEDDATRRVEGATGEDLALELRKALRLQHDNGGLHRQNASHGSVFSTPQQARQAAIQHLVHQETLKGSHYARHGLSLHVPRRHSFGTGGGLRGLFGDVALGLDEQAEGLDGVGDLFAEHEESEHEHKPFALFSGLFGRQQQSPAKKPKQHNGSSAVVSQAQEEEGKGPAASLPPIEETVEDEKER